MLRACVSRSLQTSARVIASYRALHVSAIAKSPAKRGLEERLAAGETVLCAEGYLLAISRRGYIAHGVWVPEFMLEQPDVLRSVHEEFVHAGTDVIEAFQVTCLMQHMQL